MSETATKRGSSNGNVSGSAEDRRRRRAWLLVAFESIHGPGTALCYRCGTVLTIVTLTVDRIVPGCLGGTYRRNNIRPACGPCNSETGGRLAHRGRRAS